MADVEVAGSITDRWLAFEAGFNFRDLGGYPARDGASVRWGRLFRSDTLHRLTATDLDRFAGLGLRTVVDLRSAGEIEEYGRLRDDACGSLEWHHLPMLDVVVLRPREVDAIDEPAPPPETVEPTNPYVRLLGTGDAAARAVGLLARDRALPAVFHCTAGRDRTGMVAAMVLDVLGVPDDVIAEDYALTNQARARSDAWIGQNEPTFAAYLAQFAPEKRVTRPEVILGFLAGVRDEHGSVEQLLRRHGLSGADLDRLRDGLLV